MSSVFPRASVNLLIFKSWDVYHSITLVSSPPLVSCVLRQALLPLSWHITFQPPICFVLSHVDRAGNQRESRQTETEHHGVLKRWGRACE